MEISFNLMAYVNSKIDCTQGAGFVELLQKCLLKVCALLDI